MSGQLPGLSKDHAPLEHRSPEDHWIQLAGRTGPGGAHDEVGRLAWVFRATLSEH